MLEGIVRRCSTKWAFLKKFSKIQRKTPELKSLFKKVEGLKPATLLKMNSSTGVFLWILRNFQEHLFTEHLRKNASKMFAFTVFHVESEIRSPQF